MSLHQKRLYAILEAKYFQILQFRNHFQMINSFGILQSKIYSQNVLPSETTQFGSYFQMPNIFQIF